jgi:hypothetical protein
MQARRHLASWPYTALRVLLGVQAVFSLACLVGPRALTWPQLEPLAARRYAGEVDEIFDATALALERLGYRITRLARSEGALTAVRPDGAGYEVTIEQRDARQQVVARPTPERPLVTLDGDDGEVARWDALEAATRRLLEAWREPPEWAFVARRNEVQVLSFAAGVPSSFERVVESIDRRVVTAQRFKAGHRGLNPTVLFEVARRRPDDSARPLLQKAIELALGAKGRLNWPDALDAHFDQTGAFGPAQVLDGSVPRQVTWHAWEQRTPAFTIRIAAACGPPPDTCAPAWETIVSSCTTAGFEFPPRAGLPP